MHICSLNASSLKNRKSIELKSFMLINNIDILLVQETHWSELDIESYKNFYSKSLNLSISPGEDNAREVIIALNRKWKVSEISISSIYRRENISL